MMNLLLSSSLGEGFIFFFGLLFLALTIAMIVTFFEMAKDLKKVSSNLAELILILKSERQERERQEREQHYQKMVDAGLAMPVK